MANPIVISSRAQVAEFLREELFRGRWSGTMPGRDRLAMDLGVNRKTLGAALALLEQEGILVNQGTGRPRRISLPEDGRSSRPMRLAILEFDSTEQKKGYFIDLLHQLFDNGHHAFCAKHCQVGLKFDVKRIARMVEETAADAWIVQSGSLEVLEWFAARQVPAMALFGRRSGVSIAGVGPDMLHGTKMLTRRLIELGHRRIVVLVRRQRRFPVPGACEQILLDEMAAHGLPTGNYNLPDWEETSEGFHEILDSLFQLTPPTALIVDEPYQFVAAQQHLARKGILAPEHVSLICTDPDQTFSWCKPSIAHIAWEPSPVVSRIVQWAANVSRGEEDLRQTLVKAEFFEGDTLGKVGE